MSTFIKKVKENKRLVFVFAVAFFLRLFYIGNIPGNRALYADELFSGYESWSLLHFGYDYLGYHFPVYLPVWGGGMSIMQALWQMPFILIFGLNSFALRLPAGILGCITVYCFYYICKKIKGEEFAIFAAFILAVMPWHIMQSRWGLDCNYFVGFITISIALLIKATENNRFISLALGFVGLTLYTYALPWAVMPLFVVGSFVYLLFQKKIEFNRHLIIGIVVLAVIATPLMIFLLVNYDIIPEIKTGIISFPRLSHFRSDELSLSPKAMLKRFYDSLIMFVSQDDGRVSDVTPMFGLYYKFSNCFILIGIVACIIDFYNSCKKKVMDNSAFFLILFVCAVILSGITEIFFSRINIIHIPMTYFLVLGLWYIKDLLGDKVLPVAVGVYICCAVAFLGYYVTYHDDNVAEAYIDGCESALDYVDSLYESGEADEGATVQMLSGVGFTQTIFYTKYPTDKFIEDVNYADLEVTGGANIPLTLGKYDYTRQVIEGTALQYTPGDVYVCQNTDSEAIKFLQDNGLELKYFTNIVVAH